MAMTSALNVMSLGQPHQLHLKPLFTRKLCLLRFGKYLLRNWGSFHNVTPLIAQFEGCLALSPPHVKQSRLFLSVTPGCYKALPEQGCPYCLQEALEDPTLLRAPPILTPLTTTL